MGHKGTGDQSSFTVQQGVLMATLFAVFALTVQAAQPGWWTATGGPLNSNPSDDYALANQGQLKQFTQKAVLYLNANLTNGAGTDLASMVAGWSNYYATNGYSSTNPAPADFDVINQGQLKYIGSLIYGQLEGAGYTGLTPSWLQPNTNTEYTAANLGQLKTVFNFDLLTVPPAIIGLSASNANPGEIDLSWTLPAGNNATSILIEQSTDGGVTWTSLGAVSPTDTSDVISYGSPPPGAVTYRATPSNSNGSGSPTLTSAPITYVPPVPPTPTGLAGSVDGSYYMNLTWNAVAGASSYVIDRENLTAGVWSNNIQTVSAPTTSYQDPTNQSSAYHYRISAVNSTGTSSPSAEYPPSRYAVIDLGTSNSGDFINENGQVILNGSLANPQFWDRGTSTAIVDGGGTYSFSTVGNWITGMNSNGIVVGNGYNGSASGNPQLIQVPFIWSKTGGFHTLSLYTSSIATSSADTTIYQRTVGINDSGSITGFDNENKGPGIDPPSDAIPPGIVHTGLQWVTPSVSPTTIGDSFFLDAVLYPKQVSPGTGPNKTIFSPIAINNNGLILGSTSTYQTIVDSTIGVLAAEEYYGNLDGHDTSLPLSAEYQWPATVVTSTVWDGSSFTTIPGTPIAINNTNQVVGNEDSDSKMVVWNKSGSSYVPTLVPDGPSISTTASPRAFSTNQIVDYTRIWHMTPTGTIGLPQSVSDLLPHGAGWNNVIINGLNNGGAIVGTATLTTTVGGTTTTASHGVMLAPYSLVNLADPYRGTTTNPSHLVSGVPQDTQIDLSSTLGSSDINGVAWIAAHDPANSNAPRMPELQAKIAAPSGCQVLWKLQVTFHDRHGNPHRDFDTDDPNDSNSSAYLMTDPIVSPGSYTANTPDQVTVPDPTNPTHRGDETSDGWVAITDGSPWTIYEDADWTAAITAAGFFGGDAELSVKILSSDGSITILPEQDLYFRIAGENPDPTLCKNYLTGLYGGPTSTGTLTSNPHAWFAWAIAKDETQGEGSTGYYNHFLNNGSLSQFPLLPPTPGRINWHNDGTKTSGADTDRLTGSGGYGLYQLTYASRNSTSETADANYIMPRSWLWNWQTNAVGFGSELAGKITAGQTLYNALTSTYPGNGAIPNYGNFPALDAIVVTEYNGMYGGQMKGNRVPLTGYTRPQNSCWQPFSGTWRFLQNKESYAQNVNAIITGP